MIPGGVIAAHSVRLLGGQAPAAVSDEGDIVLTSDRAVDQSLGVHEGPWAKAVRRLLPLLLAIGCRAEQRVDQDACGDDMEELGGDAQNDALPTIRRWVPAADADASAVAHQLVGIHSDM
jgi:hypothetical protein